MPVVLSHRPETRVLKRSRRVLMVYRDHAVGAESNFPVAVRGFTMAHAVTV